MSPEDNSWEWRNMGPRRSSERLKGNHTHMGSRRGRSKDHSGFRKLSEQPELDTLSAITSMAYQQTSPKAHQILGASQGTVSCLFLNRLEIMAWLES